jgi:hypothetical protein
MAVLQDDTYGGAHKYYITNCLGHNNGVTEYTEGEGQVIQFIEKPADGSPVIPGVQSEQLVLLLIDRTERLNAKFPCEENLEMIECLKGFLAVSKKRVENRVARDVMGKLEK